MLNNHQGLIVAAHIQTQNGKSGTFTVTISLSEIIVVNVLVITLAFGQNGQTCATQIFGIMTHEEFCETLTVYQYMQVFIRILVWLQQPKHELETKLLESLCEHEMLMLALREIVLLCPYRDLKINDLKIIVQFHLQFQLT